MRHGRRETDYICPFRIPNNKPSSIASKMGGAHTGVMPDEAKRRLSV